MGPQISNRTESETIAAILAGEMQLYHELIRPYERSVYLMALSYMKNETDAEDVAQEACIRAFRKFASFREESKFGTWLMSITINQAKTCLRRQSLVRTEPLDQPEDEDRSISPALLRDWREIPSEAVERREVRSLIQRAVELAPLLRATHRTSNLLTTTNQSSKRRWLPWL